jgi:hypothetical protein
MATTESSCPSGKQWSLLSQQQAENTALLIEWAEGDGVKRYAYECDQCSYWHVTRSEPRGQEVSHATQTATGPIDR